MIKLSRTIVVIALLAIFLSATVGCGRHGMSGLTEPEINYVCLYALGLRGKEIGDYMEIKRHYHVSGDIRRKLGISEYNTNLGNYIRKLLQEQC